MAFDLLDRGGEARPRRGRGVRKPALRGNKINSSSCNHDERNSIIERIQRVR